MLATTSGDTDPGSPTVTDLIQIDGFGPIPIRNPASVPELGEWVREGREAKQAIYPVGGRTHLTLGHPPRRPGWAIGMQSLKSVLEYPARDLTVTVQAGITVQDLQQVLATEGQRLSVEVPHPGSTVGGALATNTSGPRRLGLGTWRDYVIGIQFVTDEGIEVKAGGRVVKNVAGYDLMKLQIGALGTLGILTQVTFKVTPIPADQALVAFGLNTAAVGPTLDRLHSSACRPIAMEILNASAARSLNISLPEYDPWVLVLGFEEKSTTVDWQLTTLKADLKSAPVRDLIEYRGPACDPIWLALAALQHQPESQLSVKASIVPSRLGALLGEAAQAHSDALVHAHAGNGILFAHLPADLSRERAAEFIQSLGKLSQHISIRHCAPEWKSVLPVWGTARPDQDLMRTIRRTLDPQSMFNPGRLFPVDPTS